MYEYYNDTYIHSYIHTYIHSFIHTFIHTYPQLTPSSVIHTSLEGLGEYPPIKIITSDIPSPLMSTASKECPYLLNHGGIGPTALQ